MEGSIVKAFVCNYEDLLKCINVKINILTVLPEFRLLGKVSPTIFFQTFLFY
jgi:hypothetical protein